MLTWNDPILIEKESNKVVAFGYRAQAQFSRLRKTDQKKYISFENDPVSLTGESSVYRIVHLTHAATYSLQIYGNQSYASFIACTLGDADELL